MGKIGQNSYRWGMGVGEEQVLEGTSKIESVWCAVSRENRKGFGRYSVLRKGDKIVVRRVK